MVDNIVEQPSRFAQIRRNIVRVDRESSESAEKRQLDKLTSAGNGLEFLRVFLPTICGAIPQERTLVLLNRFPIPLPETTLNYSLHFEGEQDIFRQALFGYETN